VTTKLKTATAPRLFPDVRLFILSTAIRSAAKPRLAVTPAARPVVQPWATVCRAAAILSISQNTIWPSTATPPVSTMSGCCLDHLSSRPVRSAMARP
jgi:hypothetical protein